jgi:hypothetical protein
MKHLITALTALLVAALFPTAASASWTGGVHGSFTSSFRLTVRPSYGSAPTVPAQYQIVTFHSEKMYARVSEVSQEDANAQALAACEADKPAAFESNVRTDAGYTVLTKMTAMGLVVQQSRTAAKASGYDPVSSNVAMCEKY